MSFYEQYDPNTKSVMSPEEAETKNSPSIGNGFYDSIGKTEQEIAQPQQSSIGQSILQGVGAVGNGLIMGINDAVLPVKRTFAGVGVPNPLDLPEVFGTLDHKLLGTLDPRMSPDQVNKQHIRMEKEMANSPDSVAYPGAYNISRMIGEAVPYGALGAAGAVTGGSSLIGLLKGQIIRNLLKRGAEGAVMGATGGATGYGLYQLLKN